MESHVRGLESMEISSEMYGCFLTPVVMQTLPEEFRIAITRNLESETWNLKDILGAFHKELQLREQRLINNKESRPSRRHFLHQFCTLTVLRISSLLVFGAHSVMKTIRALNVMLSQVLNLEKKFLKRRASVFSVSSKDIWHVSVKHL